MRATLFAVGALLFLAYPLFVLFAVADKIDQPRQEPTTAAITFTSRSTNDLLQPETRRGRRAGLRNTTLRSPAR